MWDEELAGSRGASFLLFALPGAAEDAVKRVRSWLRQQRDVVRLSHVTPEWLPLGSMDLQVDPEEMLNNLTAK